MSLIHGEQHALHADGKHDGEDSKEDYIEDEDTPYNRYTCPINFNNATPHVFPSLSLIATYTTRVLQEKEL